MHRASAIPRDRTAQALPTSRVLTCIPAEPAATFALPSSIEHLADHAAEPLRLIDLAA